MVLFPYLDKKLTIDQFKGLGWLICGLFLLSLTIEVVSLFKKELFCRKKQRKMLSIKISPVISEQ